MTFVECKKYGPTNKVGAKIVREVVGVHTLKKPTKSLIVTTSFFTNDAIKEAKVLENELDLTDCNGIKGWLAQYK